MTAIKVVMVSMSWFLIGPVYAQSIVCDKNSANNQVPLPTGYQENSHDFDPGMPVESKYDCSGNLLTASDTRESNASLDALAGLAEQYMSFDASSSYIEGRAAINVRTNLAGSEIRLYPPTLAADHLRRDMPFIDITGSYRFAGISRGSVFGYVGLPGEPALGPLVSYMRRYAGIDTTDPSTASHWLDASRSSSRVLTVGYAWRNLKLEGSTFSSRLDEEEKLVKDYSSRRVSRSTRLSFSPATNWTFQLSRGTLSGLDQLVPDGDVRRTTVSATYQRMFKEGHWQTTLAWGRNVRKQRESTMGYLLESTLRFNGTHALFGRLEQVNSDELLRENESLQRQLFKMNKLSVGYFQEIQDKGPVRLDVGAFVSRYFVPSDMSGLYGDHPTAYMMFMRIKMQ